MEELLAAMELLEVDLRVEPTSLRKREDMRESRQERAFSGSRQRRVDTCSKEGGRVVRLKAAPVPDAVWVG